MTDITACLELSLLHLLSNISQPFNIFIFVHRCLKAGFHTRVSRTHNSVRDLLIHGYQCSQTIPAFATKTCVLAAKSHMSNLSERMWGLCRNMLWLQPMKTENAGYKKYLLTSGKKARYFWTTTFGKSLFLPQYQMRNAVFTPSNKKYLALDLTVVACDYWKNAKSFTQTNKDRNIFIRNQA